jgi:hypothetical protein
MLQRAIERGPRTVDVVADVFPVAAIDTVVVDEGDVEQYRGVVVQARACSSCEQLPLSCVHVFSGAQQGA